MPRRAPNRIVPVVLLDAAVRVQNLRLLDIIPLIATTFGCLQFLAGRGIIRNTLICPACAVNCRLNRAPVIDGFVWRCPNCRRKTSIRTDSFFYNSRLTLRQLILFIYLWCWDCPQKLIKHETGILTDNTMTNWCNFLREVCSEDQIHNNRRLGGFDANGQPIIVEIDESYYFHRKYHRGVMREGRWVFGAIERETGRVYVRVVNRRNAQTLEAIISRICLPGTHIISDSWAAYNNLGNINNGVYLHDAVNHRQNFVDPIFPWIHTNTIEGLWSHGFGPFGEHEINASWVSVQELAKADLRQDIELRVCEIPVIYKDVKERVPILWKKYDPILVVHVGVSGIATELTLEQQAHNNGYDKPDVQLMVPSTACCVSDGPDCMLSHINMSLVCEEINQSDSSVKAVVSYNAGRYLCDFTYYTSLSENCSCAAFIHVPPLGKPYSARQLADGLKIAILSMLKQVEGQRS